MSMDYITAYRRLEAALKVSYEDLRVLHHNVTGAPYVHEMLGDLYKLVEERTDEVVEIGIDIGVPEVNIGESCDQFAPASAEFRNKADTTALTIVVLERISQEIGETRAALETIESVEDVLSMLDDLKVKLRREHYKFHMLLEE